MALENLTKADFYIMLIMNGIFTGLGVAVGSWFGNKHVEKNENFAHPPKTL